MQKKKVALFSGIATAGVLALGTGLYLNQTPPPPAEVAAVADAPAAEAKAPEAQTPEAKAPETAAAETPAAPQQQVAVATPPEQPAAPATAEPVVKDQDRLPAFDTVRVEPTGEAVIAGRAEPGATVAVKFNGQVVAEATAGADGSFAIVPDKPLEQGTGALTLSMTKNGATVEGDGSVVIAVKENAPALVAKVDPVAPTEVTQVPAADAGGPPSKDVQLNAVDYDSVGNIVFTGRAEPGSIVRFYVDNALAGETAADSSGRWIFKGGAQVAPGEHTLRADQVDAAGKVLSRIELPFLRETEEVVAAAQQPAAQTEAAPAAEPEQQVAVATAEVAAPEKPAVKMTEEQQVVPSRIVIQPGHNLWKLSRQIYGRGKLYTVIYKANKDQLRSPHRIYPGQILTAPVRKADN